jgi:hypothetical protein
MTNPEITVLTKEREKKIRELSKKIYEVISDKGATISDEKMQDGIASMILLLAGFEQIAGIDIVESYKKMKSSNRWEH